MTSFEHLVIVGLDATLHDRANFRCGIEPLDRYLSKQAGQDTKRRICRVFVATTSSAPESVIGYYTLSALAIELKQLPPELNRKMPRHPLPAALLGRLAVSLSAQGHGVGKMLLADAVKRTLAVSDQIGVYAMVVDAINEDAVRFYEQFGFTRLRSHSRLFLPLKSV
jgi:GNAT superfamily N-acetyltransferase